MEKSEQIIHFSGAKEQSRSDSKEKSLSVEEANVSAIAQANDWLSRVHLKIKILERNLATDYAGYVSILYAYIPREQ